MILHVLPGDAYVETFRETGLEGEAVVCRECLIVGPVDAETQFEFWEQRARFVLSEYGRDEIEYHEHVADELEKLADLPAGAEVNLWFENELFCSVNMWFCLDLLKIAEADVYRVEPVISTVDDFWEGFGNLSPDEFNSCFAARKKFAVADIRLGSDLWNAYRTGDHPSLQVLAENDSPCFPYLKEVCKAASEIENRPREILKEITNGGAKDFDVVFQEFRKRAGVYGFGDAQVQSIMQQL